MTRHLLVIGAQRCGTTGLHHLLEAHPDIAMARPARPEPKVFMSDDLTGRGLAWYRDTYFAHASTESVLGEKSTSYVEVPAAAQRAAAMLGRVDTAIVVQLRDPVARAVSNWRFSTAHGVEDRSLHRALSDNLHRAREWDHTSTSVSPFAYLERGHYLGHLQPWLDRFDTAVHVRFLEDVVSGTAGPATLYAALGVDTDVRPPGELERVNSSGGREPELDAELRKRLHEHFRDSDDRLAAWLGRDLPWPAR